MLICDSSIIETTLLYTKKSSGTFKNVIYEMCLEITYIYICLIYMDERNVFANHIYICLKYMDEQNLALKKKQWLICQNTQPKKAKNIRMLVVQMYKF